ncbi:hypothetical protein CUMW_140450, partial [Citrus unshiu]
ACLLHPRISNSDNKTFPLHVVQEQNIQKYGLPMTFSPVNPKKGSIGLNIKFEVAKTSVQSTIWKLDNFDAALGQWFVTIGGVEGNPGPQTTRNWFKIEKFYGDYELVCCPLVCKFCKVLCIFMNGGVRHLALSDVPFSVIFLKA